MYLRITSKCNMTCEHCGFACGKKGEHMSQEVLSLALEMAEDYGHHITVGGGEPTLHPKFKNFINEILDTADTIGEGRPFIVTNGSLKTKARFLLSLAHKGRIDARLSYDQFHDMSMVDDEIFEEFDRNGWLWGQAYRAISTLVKAGRAKQFEDARDGCLCEDLIIEPDGKIRWCGCDDSPIIGDVWKGISKDIDYESCCWNFYLKMRKEELEYA